MKVTVLPHGDQTPPGLDTCLRKPVAFYQTTKFSLWVLRNGMFSPLLSTGDRQFFARSFDPEMREVDEVLLSALQERPDFAHEAQVPAALFQSTFRLETAGLQVQRAGTDLCGSLVDSILVLRLGAHNMNGQVEATVEAMVADPQAQWWQSQQYHVQWSEVGRLERIGLDKGIENRGRKNALQQGTSDQLDQLTLSQQDQADLALLAAAAGQQAAPAAPGRAAAVKKGGAAKKTTSLH